MRQPLTITGKDPATGRALAIDVADGLIASIAAGPEHESVWLAPGLVDLQVNGFNGHDINGSALTVATVEALTDAMLRVGVTTFLPTIITASEEAIVAALRAIAAARAGNPRIAHAIPFVHVEGPHLSPEDGPRGAHPRAHVRPPDIEEFRRWQAASGGLVGLVTLSPHYREAPAYIRALTREGVHVAIGHTGASPAEITAAVDAGASLSTHLGNGAAATLPRHPNFIWTQLAEDRLTATFIADGHHLPGDTFRAMLRAKGLERAVLVSDAVALGGLPPGVYDQPIGGRVELTADGRLGVAGTPFLAGAVRPLADCVAQATIMGGLTLGDALKLATVNPGRFASNRGTIRVGAPADLIRFRWAPGDSTLSLEAVFVQGERRV
ncbi:MULTISPECIES: amidohydrolase family protein [unclassified Chelatococcus]|uniref:N-acetylglucosamine-6-phosphate deacetylase n=1 Tax=unclassified Chelatococcus TaxID=2638111 RepID=UPI001BCE373A|nr:MULTISPECIES: amidohydrolase family protein [unclassified Chelatococcus]MBS7697672.1 amidohydrolase family protein [Chelatococcus sp. YT9]MBX3559046.1 amidohydrolase family protein [Chelatococcus sp.]